MSNKAVNENGVSEELILTAEDICLEEDVHKDAVAPIMHLTMVDVMDYLKEPFYVPENQVFNFRELKNRYFVIRHGESTANVRKLVVSDPKYGMLGFGLTEKGKTQMEEKARKFLFQQKIRRKQLANVIGEEAAAKRLEMDVLTDDNTIVLSSDFKRALETANIFTNVVGLKIPQTSKALRERFFGEYDMMEGNIYPNVWDLDKRNYAHRDRGVESVSQVLHRSTGLIKIIEKVRSGKNIFLVAHGDVGQILESGFRKRDPALHRGLPHLKNAEIREMWLNPLTQAA